MVCSIFQKLAIAIAGATVSLVVVETNLVRAATITYDFNATGINDPTFSFSGSFSFDDSTGTQDDRIELFPLTAYEDTLFNYVPPGGLSSISPLTAFRARNDDESFSGLVGRVFPFGGSSVILTFDRAEGSLYTRQEQNGQLVGVVREFSVDYALQDESHATSIPEPSGVVGTIAMVVGLLLYRRRVCT